ncbi:MAG: hypothetical protein KGQ59_12805 [Bdellovibrionales bacterium]|nr:hypothetical protein [Bdellovibrionales bacterium]
MKTPRRWEQLFRRSRITLLRVRKNRCVRALIAEESGQALTEYILILAFCAITAGTLSRKLMSFFDKGVLRIAEQLEQDLKSGRSPLGSWVN